jgi:hypothetical protein
VPVTPSFENVIPIAAGRRRHVELERHVIAPDLIEAGRVHEMHRFSCRLGRRGFPIVTARVDPSPTKEAL